ASAKADSTDWQLEAQAYLAPDDHRFELPYSIEGPQTQTLGHRVSKTREEIAFGAAKARENRGAELTAKQQSMLEAERAVSKVAVATYYDPKAKLRDPEELRKAAEAGDEQAHKDYYGWYSNMQRAEQMRGVEEERLAQALAVKRNGMGFSLVEGDPETDQRIWIVQRTLSPGGRYGRPNPLVADRTENGTIVVRDATPDEISEKVRSSEKFRGVMEGMIAERHSESEARLTAEAHQNYITRSINVLNEVRKEIGRGLIFGEQMPPG